MKRVLLCLFCTGLLLLTACGGDDNAHYGDIVPEQNSSLTL